MLLSENQNFMTMPYFCDQTVNKLSDFCEDALEPVTESYFHEDATYTVTKVY